MEAGKPKIIDRKTNERYYGKMFAKTAEFMKEKDLFFNFDKLNRAILDYENLSTGNIDNCWLVGKNLAEVMSELGDFISMLNKYKMEATLLYEVAQNTRDLLKDGEKTSEGDTAKKEGIDLQSLQKRAVLLRELVKTMDTLYKKIEQANYYTVELYKSESRRYAYSKNVN